MKGTAMRRTRARKPGALAIVASLALVTSACSGGGRQPEEQNDAGGGGGQVADTPPLTIAMITHEAPGDSFWDKIRSGAQVAAAKDNVDLKYSSDPQSDRQATLIQNAIDSDVDGIAVTLANPDALSEAVGAARDAGIPVVSFNSGSEQYKDVGSLMHFGSDESLAGETVGRRIAEEGGQHVLCVIMEAGQIALEQRCAGVKQGVANTENIQVTGTDIPSVTSSIQSKLQQDDSIDWVVTLGAPFAMAALESIDGVNKSDSVKVATFDLNADATQAIQDGRIQFSVDQQPYLQGYLAVDSLWLYKTNLNDIGGGTPVLTGPSIVDADNIDAIADFAAQGTR
jgi:simple sugar transport system substrate-binding protein